MTIKRKAIIVGSVCSVMALEVLRDLDNINCFFSFLKVSLKSFDDLTLALLDSFWTSFEICWQVILWVSDWDNDDPNWMCLCRLVLLTTFLQLPSTVSLICFLFAQNGIALLCWFCDDRQYEAWQIACQCLEWQIRDVSWVQQIRWYSSQGDLGLSRVCVEFVSRLEKSLAGNVSWDDVRKGVFKHRKDGSDSCSLGVVFAGYFVNEGSIRSFSWRKLEQLLFNRSLLLKRREETEDLKRNSTEAETGAMFEKEKHVQRTVRE